MPGSTPVAISARTSFRSPWLAAAEGQAEVVRYLLAAGADPRPEDRWGGTPLSDAEGNGHAEIAALLRQAAPLDDGRNVAV